MFSRITVPCPQNELSLRSHNVNCCGCLLVTVSLERICVLSSCALDTSVQHPWGNLYQNCNFLVNSMLSESFVINCASDLPLQREFVS